MAYTNDWDENSPPGTELAKNIDNVIRALKADIRERMNDIVQDWSTDPVVPKSEILGNVDGKKLLIGAHQFHLPTGTAQFLNGAINALANAGPIYGGFTLPPGSTLKGVEICFDKGTTTNVTWYVFRRRFPDGALANLTSTILSNVSGPTFSATPELTEDVDTDKMYGIIVDFNGPDVSQGNFYGARVTYNIPNSKVTL